VLEKGVSAVYGTLATGFDLGLKGAKNVDYNVQSITKKRRGKKSGRKHNKRSHRRH
jgi:hypothetical protein